MYWISVTITHAGKRGEAEVDQTARFPSRTSSDRGLEMDCIGTLFHEHLISERPSQPDKQVRGDSTHDPVYATRAGTTCVPQRHEHPNGHTAYLQSRIPAQVAEQRVEFDDQVRCELENSDRDDQIHEGSLADGCDSAREKHERENQVQSNSPGA